MQALSAEQRIGVLEKSVKEGFSEMRADSRAVQAAIKSTDRELRSEILTARGQARADFRTLLSVVFGLWVTTMLGVVGVLLNS